MKAGDLVEFMCIGAGRHDTPQYSNDGSWRQGLLIDYKEKENAIILYMAELFTIPSRQVRKIRNKDEN